MAYQVIARRWRPKTFDELVGQEHITNTLKNAIQQKKIAQAYLFSGPRGVGKTSVSRILAKALNCVEGPTVSPCGICENCKSIADGNAMDVIEIDGASNRGIDQIRELQLQVRYLPSHSKYKIYYIDEVHMLTVEAFNALLKTLEEPPGHVIFIFATTEANKVKDTIRSRCQHYNFRRLTVDIIIEQLQKICTAENIQTTTDALFLIGRSADGSMRDAEQALDQVIAFAGESFSREDVHTVLGLVREEFVIQFFQHLVQKNLPGLMQLTVEIMNSGYSLQQYSLELLIYFRHLILMTSMKPETYAQLFYLTPEQLSLLEPFVESFTAYQLNELMNILIRMNKELKDNANEQFTFESYLYRCVDYENFMSLSNIVDRLNKLENHALSKNSHLAVIQETKVPQPNQEPKHNAPSTPQSEKESFTQTEDEAHESNETADSKENLVDSETQPQKTHTQHSENPTENAADSEKLPNDYFETWIKQLAQEKDKTFLAGYLKRTEEHSFDYSKNILQLQFPSDFFYKQCVHYTDKLADHFYEMFDKEISIKMQVDSSRKTALQKESERTQKEVLELFDGEIIR